MMLMEFKEFAMRGNVLDMAMGIVIGVPLSCSTTKECNDYCFSAIPLMATRRPLCTSELKGNGT